MYIETGTSDQRRCIDIQNVIGEIREEVCLALPALHLFTGTVYARAFYGIGKVKALKILIQSKYHFKTFKAIGDQLTLNAELFPLVELFVFELYRLSQSSSTSKACYKHRILFIKEITRTTTITSDARCSVVSYEKNNYVTSAIQKSLIPCPVIPSPCVDYG